MPAFDTLTLLAVVGALGAAFGWLWARHVPRGGRWLLGGAAAVLAFPVVMFGLANLLGSDVLGWVAGLSMMVLLALGLPAGAGLLVGAALGRWRRGVPAPAPGPVGAAPAPVPGPAGAAPAPAAGPAPAAAPTPSPRAAPRTTPHPQRGLLWVMAGVAAGFWVALAVGFRWHGQVAPAPLDAGLWPAAAVLLFALVRGAKALRHLPLRSAHGVYGGRAPRHSNWAQQHQHWLATLRADPLRRVYAERIAAGDSFWTPDRIEYDLDPAATACCTHLAPIEHRMRAEGLVVRLQGGQGVQAHCRLAAAALPLPPEVVYEEPQAHDRSLEDPPVARLRCTTCPSTLWVRHAREAPDAPVWPGPAAAG